MKKIYFAPAAVVFQLQLSAAEPELKGSPQELAAFLATVPKTVSVAGEAELKVPADRAEVSLKVTTEHKSLQETLRANQEVRAKIIAALKERDIPAERVQAAKFSSTVRTGPFSDKPRSYRVENTLKIKVQDEKEFHSVAFVVDAMPEVQYQSVDFEHSDKEKYKARALEQALDNAAARKRIYEEHLGVKLTPKGFAMPMVVEDVPRRRYESGVYGSAGASPAFASRSAEGIAKDGGDEAVLLFGELVFKTRVTVEYAVETK